MTPYLVLMFFFGLSAGTVGKIKGSSFLIWFLIGFAVPVLGTLAAVFHRYERRELRRRCEECGNVVPVVLAALDRVATSREPETLGVYVTTLSWWLIRRLRGLGFHVFWPSWVMCSVPLPGLDRYVPTRPPHVL